MTTSDLPLSPCSLPLSGERDKQAAPVYSAERWYQLLQLAVDRDGVVAVAKRLGYNNHSSTSMVLRGTYLGKTDRFAERVLKHYDVVACPHLRTGITQEQCRETALSRAPLNNPLRMTHWRACQCCPHKPEVKHGQPK